MTSLADLTATTPGLPCRTTDPELWFSNYPRDRRTAASHCTPCPLRAACQSYAFETQQSWGVWGGVDFTAVETHCGTDRGHQIHARNGEIPCEPCQKAHAELVDGRRRKQLEAEHAKGGTVRGYAIHRRLGEDACVACRAASARESAAHRARDREGAERARAVWDAPRAADRLRGAPAGAQPLPVAV